MSNDRSSLSQTLKAGSRAGLGVGVLAGTFDGLVRTVGIDPGLFILRMQQNGLRDALTHGLPQDRSEVLDLLGCTASAAAIYGVALALVAVLFGALLHPLLRRRRDPDGDQLALWLGVWFFLEVYWWTRPLVLPGLPATSVKRVLAAAVMLVICLGLGVLAGRLRRSLPDRVIPNLSVVAVIVTLIGGVYLRIDRSSSAAHLGQVNERNEDMPNVLIFVVDALRQDVLACYGNDLVRTPHMDRVAAEGVLFADAMVQAPFTWPSFGSFLTGKYPRRHGLIRMKPGHILPPNLTLPEYLHGAPRKDGAPFEGEDMVGAAFLTGTLSHGSGLARGFDYYFEALVGHELVDVHSRWSEFRSGLLPWLYKNKLHQKLDNQLVAATAREWFSENANRRFVAMVHYYSTHTPYDPPAEYRSMYCDPEYDGPISAFYASHREAIERGKYAPTEADERQIRDLYHAGVTQADAMIGEVVEELRRQGVLDDTIVVVTSDHGESLGEHGLWEHNFMYQDNLRIPLLLRWPDGLPQGAVVEGLVESIDVLPTLTELMGLEGLTHASELVPDAGLDEQRNAIDGVSLLPRIRGEVDVVRPYSFAENDMFRSIQDERWKLILRSEHTSAEGFEEALGLEEGLRPRFFDLVQDPLELDNLFLSAYDEHQVRIGELRALLHAWSESMPIRDDHTRSSARDLETQRALFKALGYGGGVGSDADEGDGE
jgi:arylsulfatase A-like enzyme